MKSKLVFLVIVFAANLSIAADCGKIILDDIREAAAALEATVEKQNIVDDVFGLAVGDKVNVHLVSGESHSDLFVKDKRTAVVLESSSDRQTFTISLQKPVYIFQRSILASSADDKEIEYDDIASIEILKPVLRVGKKQFLVSDSWLFSRRETISKGAVLGVLKIADMEQLDAGGFHSPIIYEGASVIDGLVYYTFSYTHTYWYSSDSQKSKFTVERGRILEVQERATRF